MALRQSCHKFQDTKIIKILWTKIAELLQYHQAKHNQSRWFTLYSGLATTLTKICSKVKVIFFCNWTLFCTVSERNEGTCIEMKIKTCSRLSWAGMCVDEVWSILPALGLLSLDCSSRLGGSNSDADKMDQTSFTHMPAHDDCEHVLFAEFRLSFKCLSSWADYCSDDIFIPAQNLWSIIERFCKWENIVHWPIRQLWNSPFMKNVQQWWNITDRWSNVLSTNKIKSSHMEHSLI